MSRRTAAVIWTTILALGLSACGETIDLRDSAPDETALEATALDETAPEVSALDETSLDETSLDETALEDKPLEELLPVMLDGWRGMGEYVIDGDADEPLARIETAWAAAEPIIRREHPDSLGGFQQAIDLVRTAVERRRPADVSKGYLLAVELTNHVLDDTR